MLILPVPFIFSAAWTPADAAYWFDPSDLTTMYGNNTGSTSGGNVSVGGKVGTIANKGTAGGYMVSATASSSQWPTLSQSGSLYYLDFTGITQGFSTQGNVASSHNVWMATATSRSGTPSYYAGMMGMDNGGYGNAGSFIVANDASSQTNTTIWVNGGALTALRTNLAAVGTPFVLSAYKSGTSVGIRSNNNSATTTTITDTAISARPYTIEEGTPGFTNYYGSVLYTGTPPAGESTVITWLGAKAGITI